MALDTKVITQVDRVRAIPQGTLYFYEDPLA